jgi:type II restriction enzyme
MKLSLYLDVAARYKSLSQRARVMTETWVEDNLYCPSCPSEYLESAPPNEKVFDFNCNECDEKFQLKSQSHSFGGKVMNSAYDPKIKAFAKGQTQTICFYNTTQLSIKLNIYSSFQNTSCHLQLSKREKPYPLLHGEAAG